MNIKIILAVAWALALVTGALAQRSATRLNESPGAVKADQKLDGGSVNRRFYVTDRRRDDYSPFIPSAAQIEEAKRAKESRPADDIIEKEVDASWGRVACGFQMSLWLAKVVFTNGEPISARVFLRNVSDEPLEYDFADPRNVDLEFHASRDGQELARAAEPKPRLTFDEKLRDLSNGQRPTAILPVGTQREFIVDLRNLFNLTINGEYALRVEWEIMKMPVVRRILGLATNTQDTAENHEKMQALLHNAGPAHLNSLAVFTILSPPLPAEARLWGPASEGFRVMIRVPEAPLRVGEPVPISFVIRNVDTVRLWSHGLWYWGKKLNPEVIVTDDRGGRLQTRAEQAIKTRLDRINFEMERDIHPVRIGSCMERAYDVRLDEDYDLTVPDRYAVFVRFKVPLRGTDHNSTNQVFAEAVSGTVPMIVYQDPAQPPITNTASGLNHGPGPERLWRDALSPEASGRAGEK